MYHRYNQDGYGEQADASPFAGNGVGRAWPLLVGERGHLTLQAGEDPLPYLKTMHACASTGGLLPEQVWDCDAIVDRELFPGRPSGSAMPLLWSHAEFLKLLIARASGRPLELLSDVERHFGSPQTCAATARHWRNSAPFSTLERGVSLLIEDSQPFTLHWGVNVWQQIQDRDATLGPWGLWAVQFSAAELLGYRRLDFTRRFAGGWEGVDHSLGLE